MKYTEQELERGLEDVQEQVFEIIVKSEILDYLIDREKYQRFPNYDHLPESTRDEISCTCWLLVMNRFLRRIA